MGMEITYSKYKNMEKQLTITLNGEGKHADIMSVNLTNEEIRDFFGEITALLALNPAEYKSFKVALQSCVETLSIVQKRKDNSSENVKKIEMT